MNGITRMAKRLAVLIAMAALAVTLVPGISGCTHDDQAGPYTDKGGGDQMQTEAQATYPESIDPKDYEAQLKVQQDNPVDPAFLSDVQTFSYTSASQILSSDLSQDGSKVNANYSPASLYFALAASGTGAGGTTQQEILGLLGTDDPSALSTQSGNLYRQMYSDNEAATLKLANSLWMADDASFKQPFLDTATSQFYASEYRVKFGSPETDAAIAGWISDQTSGTLTPQVQTTPDDRLCIINTLYFKDSWETRFYEEDNEEAPFHATSGDKDATYLTCTYSSGSYLRGSNYTRASLMFSDGATMTFVLPDEGVSCEELLATPESTASLFDTKDNRSAEVTYHVPKFSFDTEGSLVSDLKALGVEEAFTDDADFSNMTDEQVKMSDVMQGTHFALDEEGVEASAYTMMTMTTTEALDFPDETFDFRLDRPFIFLVSSKEGVPLFMGVCGDPTV